MKEVTQLCDACKGDLEAAGYDVEPVSTCGKITCGVCGRDGYGAVYCVTKGEKGVKK